VSLNATSSPRPAGALAEALDGWAPGAVHSARRVDPWPAAAFAALLDTPAPALNPGDPLPPLWHWFTLLEHPAHAELGADGHPAQGHFLPPIPHRRRMFAGGRYRQQRPIPVGAELTCRSSLADVAVKHGRSGELAFVTIRHELTVAGTPVGAEEQDIVYRSQPDGTPRTRPAATAATGTPTATAPAAPDWQLTLPTDPVRLFRFSALTYNGHRIHYDQPYSTAVEGYPGLVVHGPLLALLALELPRRHAPAETVGEFAYRLVRPAFAGAVIQATGHRHGPEVALAVGAERGGSSLTATATLRPAPEQPDPVSPGLAATDEVGAP
jgi:3-methylfumaryl-CoA hydratase